MTLSHFQCLEHFVIKLLDEKHWCFSVSKYKNFCFSLIQKQLNTPQFYKRLAEVPGAARDNLQSAENI